jgi:protein-tyrosine phosphatase
MADGIEPFAIEPFRIATLAAPGGGRLGLCRLPGRSGELTGDVSAIAAWGAGTVVSMTPADEMAAKGAAGLPAALAAAGIAWRGFPIVDYGAPDGTGEAWAGLGHLLHAALDRGEGVLLHCAGGKGRSGMVAMRLLVERGIAPEAALATVRAIRPGAVETREQERWASRLP